MNNRIDGSPFLALLFYLEIAILLGAASIFIFKLKKRTLFEKTLLIICPITVSFGSLWIVSVFFPTLGAQRIVLPLATVLWPMLWLLISIGVIIYGSAAIVTRQTFVKVGFITDQLSGPVAVYFGILWILAGLLMLFLELGAFGVVLCGQSTFLCPLVTFADKCLNLLSLLIVNLSKPLQWTELIRSY